MAPRVILCLNSGSSSLKFALYRIADGEEILLAQGAVERDAQSARLWIHSPQRKIEKTSGEMSSVSAALHAASVELELLELPRFDAVGHRLVHGGQHQAVPE